MTNLVERLFIESTQEESMIRFNYELKLQFGNDQEAAQFLVDTIRCWNSKINVFCGSRMVDTPESKWGTFGYKTPSDCGGCIRAQKVLDKIFGSRHKFNELPFVTYHGDRQYSFSFDVLKHFAENGAESTVRLIETQKQEAARKKLKAEVEKKRREKEEQNAQLNERLGDLIISDELRQQLLPYAGYESLVICSGDIAAVKTSRSVDTSAGSAMYEQVRVFYRSQHMMREWKWRDAYDKSKDDWSVRVKNLKQIDISNEDGHLSVSIEIENFSGDKRREKFIFDQPKISAKTLSVKAQITFNAKVENEISRIMADLKKRWECKPQMLGPNGYISYRPPFVIQREIKSEIGVAAFVTQEQIDHRGSDPQMRYELYVLTAKGKKAESKTESHGYNGKDGGAQLGIVDVTAEKIIIDTKNGQEVIAL